MTPYRYRLELEPDDNDTWLVTCPDLPEVTSYGESRDEAINHGRDAVAEAIAARLARFEPIPEPSSGSSTIMVALPLRLQPKVALMKVMSARRITRADLVRATGWSRTSVDRLFHPGHNSRLEQFEEAFRATGAEPAFSVELDASATG